MGNVSGRETAKDCTVLSENEIQTLLNNTSFDREQILDWHKGFLEQCPTGKMNREQFLAFYTKLYPNGNASKFCRQVFKVFDSNNNGSIEFKELMMVISVTTMGDMRKKLELAFVLYDLDRNGQIDKREMEKIVNAIYDLLDSSKNDSESSSSSCIGGGSAPGSVAADRVEAIMKKLDKNNDQVLSRDEFINGCLDDPVIREILVPYA